MGSNPISPTIIFDTSPLQAIYRSGALPVLQAAFGEVLIPGAVFEETLASVSLAAAGNVPHLEEFPWIKVCPVSDAEIESVGPVLIKSRRSTQVYNWFGRNLDRPEIEAIVLGRRTSGRVVIEDDNGTKCAADFGIATINVADLLIELERANHISDAKAHATAILDTGYYSKELRWLSWRW